MKYYTPKSYRIKHKILEFLSKERMKNGGKNPVAEYTFSLKKISDSINEDYNDVYSISDYLFYKKLVYCTRNDQELMNPYCFATDKGVEAYSSFSFINDGKLLQTTLFNNLSTGFFQIIVGIIAIVTIIFNYNDSKLYHEQVKMLEQEVRHLSIKLSEQSKEKSTENYSDKIKVNYQTNIQTDDTTSTESGPH
ncbi:hypothetical protein V1387_06290 [Allomuricauda taeanensis]|uniref:hypothetical protein n=1 Tax=Flagellimonas taeanensis TaxID=1005926 RepID=UPI002E7C4518|nr:hypothetical protein [Allomuricauda taeanensis]MEE1962285.1 hypothetical protein [Allomuricauda taeanensis]